MLFRFIFLLIFSLTICEAAPEPWKASQTEKYRLMWNGDPTSEATIGWHQREGAPGVVHYGTVDQGRNAAAFAKSQPVDEFNDFDGFQNCFVRLRGLRADTEYYFVIRDEFGTSGRYKFRTAPSDASSFTFVAGGDSRNFRDVRVAANIIAKQLRPLFIAFTGDMINLDNKSQWDEWMNDWQYTIADDGHMIPIVAHRGNHERRSKTIPKYFDTPKDVWWAFSIGGDLFRYYVLNSEIPAGGEQREWLAGDLAKHSGNVTHLAAGYHKPMRPHVERKSEGINPYKWAELFYAHGLDLAIESDSHCIKRTLPLIPSDAGDEGFIAAATDPKATVFVGEGCWGAPLRAADDRKSWTLDAGTFNGFEWIRVAADAMDVKTVVAENPSRVTAVNPLFPFTDPVGIKIWDAKGGAVLRIDAD